MIDSGRTGKINKKNLTRVFGLLALPADEDATAEMLQTVTGRESLNFDRFLEIMASSLQNRSSDDILRAAFEVFDTDSSGQISVGELRNLITKLGENLSEEEYAEMMRGVDVDGSGSIDFLEFKAVLGTPGS